MSTLFYNGITLELVKTLGYQRRFEMDGHAYLWTRHRLVVQGVYNPRATSYSGPDPGAPAATPGCAPPCTDAAIRHRLSQPQKKLIYSAAPAPAATVALPPGSPVVLDCPPSLDPNAPNFSTNTNLDRYFTDANNGPRPFHLNLREMLGLKTWFVEFGVECCVNECYRPFGKPPILLAHMWRMRSDMDRDGFTTRHVSGHYVFRTDALLDNLATPDDFRDVLAHPIPPNFERRGVVCEQNEEGNRVDYQFLDREVSHNITVRNVTRIEAYVQAGQAIPSPEGAARNFVNELIRGGGPALRGASARALVGLLPVGSVRLVVRVWGNRNARRTSLLDTAARVVAVKFPQGIESRQNRGPFAEDVDVTMDLMGRYVQVEATYTAGPFGNALTVASGAQLGDVFPELFDMEVGDVATRSERPGRAPVPGTITRGTYLGALVAQLLKTSCRNPSYPPNHTPYNETQLPPVA
jgi:hypothetical protein